MNETSPAHKPPALNDIYQFARTNPYSTLYHSLPDLPSPVERWDEVSMISRQHLERESVLLHYPESHVRYLVSEFDADRVDELFLIPQRLDYLWHSLDRQIELHDPTVALLSVPLFWQLGPMFYHTARRRSVPVSVMPPRNLPLARQLIKEANVEMVVATPSVARELHDLLMADGIGEQIRAWHLVVPFGERVAKLSLSGDVTVEHHLFPGVPIASTIDSTQLGTCTPALDYFFEVNEIGEGVVSSIQKHAFPFIRFNTGIIIRPKRGDLSEFSL